MTEVKRTARFTSVTTADAQKSCVVWKYVDIILGMTDRASAIIISKRHLLLIHRIRAGKDFYVFPGGHIEAGESAEEACIREVLEETGLSTAWLSPAFDYAVPKQMAHYFFVQVIPGTLVFSGPETQKQSGQNRYILEWVPLVQISRFNLQPEAVRDALAAVVAQHGPAPEAADLALYREQLQEILLKSNSGLTT